MILRVGVVAVMIFGELYHSMLHTNNFDHCSELCFAEESAGSRHFAGMATRMRFAKGLRYSGSIFHKSPSVTAFMEIPKGDLRVHKYNPLESAPAIPATFFQ